MILPKPSNSLDWSRCLRSLRPGASPDALVVGAGLAGLLTAALLLKNGASVHLTEKLAQPGGRLSPRRREGFTFGAGFAFGDSGWWRAAADRLGLAAETLPVSEGGSLLHGSRGWVAPQEVAAEVPAWEEYLSRPCTEFPVNGMLGITEKLFEICAAYDNFSYSLESPLTAITGAHGVVKEVSLGAELQVSPGAVHYTADYKTLLEVLRGEGVPEPGPERVSWLKKYVKSHLQPGVILEFAHKSTPADFTETLLLPFSAGEREERRYLVGSFTSQRDPGLAPPGQAVSTWILPLTEAEWGDNHESMKKIRSARRMLDKAFPNFDQGILFERVLVMDSTAAPLAKKKGELHPLMKNLFLASDWALPHGATAESLVETLLG